MIKFVVPAFLFLLVSPGGSLAVSLDSNQIEGRWSLVVLGPQGPFPSWLEVTRSDQRLSGRLVGRVGSVRPLEKIEFQEGTLRFSLPPQYEKMKHPLRFEGAFTEKGSLSGTAELEGGVLPWVGTRAPELAAPSEPRWGAPVRLFNGEDLTGWFPRDPDAPSGWRVTDGVLENRGPSGDIVSGRRFQSFKLHIEFNIAPGSNSGIYLNGRYEVQIQDDFGKPPGSLLVGGVYGFLKPRENACKTANRWQSYDLTLLGRFVTVVLNGKKIIDHQEIPGITGGALDSKEGEPGPIVLQGDHGNVSFRNIVVTPVK